MDENQYVAFRSAFLITCSATVFIVIALGAYVMIDEGINKMLEMKESQIHHEANAAYYKTRMIECLEEKYDND